MTVSQAGRLGGQATLKTYGRAHFVRLGKRSARLHPLPPEERRRRGKLGGDASRARLGIEHYEEIGRRGGESVLTHYGKDYYADIARLGVAKRRAARDAPTEA